LLVEDNTVNRMVALGMLGKLGPLGQPYINALTATR
jgi:hypothetical protein